MTDRPTALRNQTAARMAGAANDPFREGLVQTLAQHDAAIVGLSGRMTGVENGLKGLQGEVHAGFNGVQNSLATSIGNLSSKFDRLDAAPKLDIHKIIGSVVAIAILFSMICGGIVWIAGGQFAASFAKQDAFNTSIAKTVDRHDSKLEQLGEWMTTVHVKVPKRERSQ